MSCEQKLITKKHIATHTNLILWFKPGQYSGTLVKNFLKVSIKPEFTVIANLSVSFVTHTAHPLKLKCSVLLVLYSHLLGNEQQIQHYLVLL